MADTTLFPDLVPTILIPISAVIAIVFGIVLWGRVAAVKVGRGQNSVRSENGREYLLEEEGRGEDEVRRLLPMLVPFLRCLEFWPSMPVKQQARHSYLFSSTCCRAR